MRNRNANVQIIFTRRWRDMNASFIKTKRLAKVNRREVMREEILFTTNLIIAKSVNKLLLETSV